MVCCLSRLKRVGVRTPMLLRIFRSLFLRHINYCLSSWGASYSSNLQQRRICMNNALRAIFALSRDSSVSKLYVKNGLLDVDKLYKYRVACLAFRSINNALPSSLATNLVGNREVPLRNDRHLNIVSGYVTTNLV